MSRPPRILLAGLFHETHTFLEGTTPLSAFAVRRGDDILEMKGDASPFGGVLELAEEFGWEALPTVDYRAHPSAIVEDAVLEAFWADLEDHASPHLTGGVDAIYVVLHGAMVTQSFDDVEGEVLRRLRGLPGAGSVPIFGVFDLHANFTPQMAERSTCLVAYRQNPHTDAREMACHAARLLQRCMQTEETPAQQFIHPPLLWPPTGTGTATEPMMSLEAMAREMELLPGIWSVNVVAGFSFADTAYTGVSFVISATSDAQPLLQQLADKAWQLRELGNVIEPPVSEVMGGLAEPPRRADRAGRTLRQHRRWCPWRRHRPHACADSLAGAQLRRLHCRCRGRGRSFQGPQRRPDYALHRWQRQPYGPRAGPD